MKRILIPTKSRCPNTSEPPYHGGKDLLLEKGGGFPPDFSWRFQKSMTSRRDLENWESERMQRKDKFSLTNAKKKKRG